jgi:hypothetical protein
MATSKNLSWFESVKEQVGNAGRLAAERVGNGKLLDDIHRRTDRLKELRHMIADIIMPFLADLGWTLARSGMKVVDVGAVAGLATPADMAGIVKDVHHQTQTQTIAIGTPPKWRCLGEGCSRYITKS